MYKLTPVLAAAMLMVPFDAYASAASDNNFSSRTKTVEDDPLTQKELTLDEAIRLAVSSDDPYLLEPGEQAAALEDRSVADSQLADPKLRFNFANWPTNSFSYSQEPMTQVQLGISQAFPKGDTLKYRRAKRLVQAKGQRYKQSLRLREVILDTRLNWLELYYWSEAKNKVGESRQAVAELIQIVAAIYATGRETSQDILRAQLELSLLDDRLVEIERKSSVARAALARRIGTAAANRRLTKARPVVRHPSDIAVTRDLLNQHPAIQMFDANVDAADKDVAIAAEQKKPGWSVNVGYGARGGDRADFASVGVVMDMPIFTGKRQDKQISAAKRLRQASRLSRDSVLLDLEKTLQTAFADWQQLQNRVSLYQSVVLKRAKETTEASLTSYQSGVTDFPELVRARLAELDAELKLLRLQADRLKAQSKLLFLEGEDDA